MLGSYNFQSLSGLEIRASEFVSEFKNDEFEPVDNWQEMFEAMTYWHFALDLIDLMKPVPVYYQFGNIIVCHPNNITVLKNALLCR